MEESSKIPQFDILKDEWVITDKLTLQEREILFITCESANLEVYSVTRANRNIKEYPHLVKRNRSTFKLGLIVGCHSIINSGQSTELTYQIVLEMLREKIRNG